MTLNTSVFVLDQIRHKDVFAKCGQLIGATEQTEFTDGPVKSWRKGESYIEPGKPWNIGNKIAQGLPALLDVYYQPDGPYRATASDCLWYCGVGGDCDDEHDSPACWLEVNFDTAYSYRDEQGRGCGDLHASLVSQLGQWLDGHGVRWLWDNEFTGEVHSGYDRLIDLCSNGAEASAWFRTAVMPAIGGAA